MFYSVGLDSEIDGLIRCQMVTKNHFPVISRHLLSTDVDGSAITQKTIIHRVTGLFHYSIFKWLFRSFSGRLQAMVS